MTDNHLEALFAQMLKGITELVNGEGGNNRIKNVSVDACGNAVRVELLDMNRNFLLSLVDEIRESAAQWRVNPFSSIVYEGNNVLSFNLKPIEEIEHLYSQNRL